MAACEPFCDEVTDASRPAGRTTRRERSLGQRRRGADAAPARHPVHQPQSGRQLSRAARQPGQSPRQRTAGHPALSARGSLGLDRARLRQGDRRADGLRAAQQCGAAARHDEPVQRLVRSRADDRAGRYRSGRCRKAPALDRLDSYLARSRRPDPLLHQMGRPADLGARAGGIDVPRQSRDPHGADRAGLYLPRRRLSGSAARQGAGMARPDALHPARAVASVSQGGRYGGGAARARRAAGGHVRPRLAPRRILATAHPAHYLPPFNVLPTPARELLCEADVILALDWVDLGGALRQAKAAGKVAAKIVNATLDHNLHTGANMEYQALPAADVSMAATGDMAIEDLLESLGEGARKEPWKQRAPAKPRAGNGHVVSMEQVASILRAEFNDPENVTF